jgi:hypothetical protein
MFGHGLFKATGVRQSQLAISDNGGGSLQKVMPRGNGI